MSVRLGPSAVPLLVLERMGMEMGIRIEKEMDGDMWGWG